MSVLFLEPHHDDAVLFSCYTLLRYRPTVVTCFTSCVQAARGGPDQETRVWETKQAMHMVGANAWIQLPTRDDDTDLGLPTFIRSTLRLLDNQGEWTRVFAPAVELGGHEQHNMVGAAAEEVFGDRVRFYMTYVRGQGRSQSENEVIPEPDWPAVKFKAMSCYISQINLPDCRPWFAADDALREWMA